MRKRFHDVRSMKKALDHGAQNGIGVFKQRPRKPKPSKKQKEAR